MSVKNDKRVYWPKETWKEEKPASVGMNPKKFSELDHIILSQYKNIKGIIVVRKGSVVFERYSGVTPLDTHNVTSVAKSFISALIGIAIEKGLIESIDRKVFDFFPDYKTPPSDFRKRSVSVRQLLTMTAPIASKSIGSRWEPLDRLRRQPNWTKYALDLLGKGQPGRFQYSTAGTHLLSAIITRATGMSTREFANEYLFQPIGISPAQC